MGQLVRRNFPDYGFAVQLSIPIGAAMGVMILKEPKSMPKFVGVAIMLVGLILVGAG